MGFSYAGPLLKHLSKRVGGNVLLDVAGDVALRFASRRAAVFAPTLWIALGAVAASWIIGKIEDADRLEKWCKRSGFRKPVEPETKPKSPLPLYDKPGEELTELYASFKAVSE